MAVYKLPISGTRRKGSNGGNTFQKTANGFIIRKRAVPVQKRTARQSQVKTQFENVTGLWRNLTVGEKASWPAGAPNFPRIDSLGNSYDLKGPALQNSSNINLQNGGVAPIQTLPASGGFPAWNLGAISFNLNVNTMAYFLDINTVPVGYSMNFFVAPITQLNRSTGAIESMLLMHSFSSGQSLIINFWPDWVRIQGGLEAGTFGQLWGAVTMTEDATGQKDTPQINPGSVF
jgi:hypothetical protein